MAYLIHVKMRDDEWQKIEHYCRTVRDVWQNLYFGPRRIPVSVRITERHSGESETVYNGSYAGSVMWALGIDSEKLVGDIHGELFPQEGGHDG